MVAIATASIFPEHFVDFERKLAIFLKKGGNLCHFQKASQSERRNVWHVFQNTWSIPEEIVKRFNSGKSGNLLKKDWQSLWMLANAGNIWLCFRKEWQYFAVKIQKFWLFKWNVAITQDQVAVFSEEYDNHLGSLCHYFGRWEKQ